MKLWVVPARESGVGYPVMGARIIRCGGADFGGGTTAVSSREQQGRDAPTPGYGVACRGHLHRQTLTGDQVHLFAEAIQLAERGVNVRGDAESLKFFVNDRDGKDVVLVEEILGDGFRVRAFDLDVGDGARLVRIERGVELYLRHVLELVHPVTGAVT